MESTDSKNLVTEKVSTTDKDRDDKKDVKGNFLEAEDKRDELIMKLKHTLAPKVIQKPQLKFDSEIDRLYKNVILPCINNIQNCPVQGPADTVHEHFKKCEFLPNYVCIHPNCHTGPISCSKLVEHLRIVHDSLLLDDYDEDENCSHYIEWKIDDDVTEYLSAPLIFQFKSCPFLLMMEVRGEFFYIWMRDLKNVASSKNIKFFINVTGTLLDDETWTEVPEPHQYPPKSVDHRKRNSFEMKLLTFRRLHLNYQKPAGFTIRIDPSID